MEVYAGLDLHATNTHVAMIDAENKVLYKQRHKNDVPAILSALPLMGTIFALSQP